MKKIKIDDKILIINEGKLSIERTKLIKITPKEWEVQTYLEDICPNLNAECEQCIFNKTECTYKDWKPGLKKGRRW